MGHDDYFILGLSSIRSKTLWNIASHFSLDSVGGRGAIIFKDSRKTIKMLCVLLHIYLLL